MFSGEKTKKKLAKHQSRNRAASSDELHAAAVGGSKGLKQLAVTKEKEQSEAEKKVSDAMKCDVMRCSVM